MYIFGMKLGLVRRLDVEDDILSIEVSGGKMIFHTIDGEYTQISTLSEFEQLLQDQHYLRLDHGNLVNMKKVEKVDLEKMLVVFEGGTHATISRRKKWQLIEYLNKHNILSVNNTKSK